MREHDIIAADITALFLYSDQVYMLFEVTHQLSLVVLTDNNFMKCNASDM